MRVNLDGKFSINFILSIIITCVGYSFIIESIPKQVYVIIGTSIFISTILTFCWRWMISTLLNKLYEIDVKKDDELKYNPETWGMILWENLGSTGNEKNKENEDG